MKKSFLVAATLLFVTSAMADLYEYKCYSFRGSMTLIVDGDQAFADINGETWDKDIGGKQNLKYKSKGIIKFLKFGTNLLLEESLVDGGLELRDGTLGGIARVEGEAEGGFYQYKYICKR